MPLQVEGLHAGYGRVRVLHGVGVEVDARRVGLFGPNGHGKTTLLRAISGLVKPSAGRVIFEGRDIAGLSPPEIVALGLVHVPQGSTLLPGMTVMEALTLGAYAKRAWGERRRTLEEVFHIFPRLAERRRQRCNTLSGGERQMAAIGAGLMGRPRLLMLDEPTLGLAPKLRATLAKAIHEIAATGVGLLVVDQDIDMLLGLCDRIVTLRRGRTVAEFGPGASEHEVLAVAEANEDREVVG